MGNNKKDDECVNKWTHLFAAILIYFVWLLFDKTIAPYFIFILAGAYAPDLDALPPFNRWHRVLFHNILFLFLIIIFLYNFLVPLVALKLFTVGFLSHIILDSMTLQGINIFQPFTNHPNIKGPFRTGGIFDKMLLGAFIIGTIYLIWLMMNGV